MTNFRAERKQYFAHERMESLEKILQELANIEFMNEASSSRPCSRK